MITTKQLIENFPNLADDTRAALLSALATRGQHKGFLLAQAPNPGDNLQRWIAWQAIIVNLAPARTNTFGLVMVDPAGQHLFKKLDAVLVETGLRTAINAVEPALRWNLYAHRHNVDAEREALARQFNIQPETAAPIDKEKAAKAFIAARKRLAKRPCKTQSLRAVGGPFNGDYLVIAKHGDGKTAMLRVGDWHGRYVANDTRYASRLNWIAAE